MKFPKPYFEKTEDIYDDDAWISLSEARDKWPLLTSTYLNNIKFSKKEYSGFFRQPHGKFSTVLIYIHWARRISEYREKKIKEDEKRDMEQLKLLENKKDEQLYNNDIKKPHYELDEDNETILLNLLLIKLRNINNRISVIENNQKIILNGLGL